MSSLSFAKIEPQFEKLRDMQFSCEVVSAVETRNGVVTKKSNEASVMETMNQIGDEETTDYKCFLTSVTNAEGEDSKMGFGCLPLDSKHVKKFTNDKLKIKRSEYNEVVEIDFNTGKGSHTFSTRNCDWGRHCVTAIGKSEFKNCVIK
jgi:PDZ domain-containing secreted protein